METKTKIIVSRSSEWVNRLRGYKILINGNQAGTVKNGGSEEFLVQPGNNTVQCKVDWYSSSPFSIDIREGDTAYLKVRSGMKFYWPFMIAVIIGVFLMFYYKGKQDAPAWITPVTLVLIIPGALYSLYYMTLGRKNFLVIQKDAKNIFA